MSLSKIDFDTSVEVVRIQPAEKRYARMLRMRMRAAMASSPWPDQGLPRHLNSWDLA